MIIKTRMVKCDRVTEDSAKTSSATKPCPSYSPTFISTIASGNPSHASGQLPSLEHAYRPGEVLHISSARIAATVESYGIQYTRLNYVKIGK